jgi:hypothetical protein
MKYFSCIASAFIGALFFLGAPSGARAQTPFFPDPAPLKSAVVQPNLANEVYLYLNNPSGDSLRLRWRLGEASIPQGWGAALCDYGYCYFGVPNSGTMNWVHDTIQPYLKLVVIPNIVPGSAWYWFRVFEVGQDENYQDVYFSLYTQGVTGTSAPEAAGVAISPNPAVDYINIRSTFDQPVPARIYSAQGVLMQQLNLQPAAQQIVFCHNWPPGVYYLQTAAFTRKIIVGQ